MSYLGHKVFALVDIFKSQRIMPASDISLRVQRSKIPDELDVVFMSYLPRAVVPFVG